MTKIELAPITYTDAATATDGVKSAFHDTLQAQAGRTLAGKEYQNKATATGQAIAGAIAIEGALSGADTDVILSELFDAVVIAENPKRTKEGALPKAFQNAWNRSLKVAFDLGVVQSDERKAASAANAANAKKKAEKAARELLGLPESGDITPETLSFHTFAPEFVALLVELDSDEDSLAWQEYIIRAVQAAMRGSKSCAIPEKLRLAA